MGNTSLVKSWNNIEREQLKEVIPELQGLLRKNSILFLEGPVGSGKTTLVQSFTQSYLNHDEVVQSPTYSILYEQGPILHADFYRLKGAEEIVYLELDIYLEDKDYFFIEWGEFFKDSLENIISNEYFFYKLEIEVSSNTSRNYFLSTYRDNF